MDNQEAPNNGAFLLYTAKQMKKVLLIGTLLMVLSFGAMAQMTRDSVVFSGTVIDDRNGDSIPFVSVTATQSRGEHNSWMAQTDFDGYFSMTIPKGVYDIKATYIGYTDNNMHLRVKRNGRRYIIKMERESTCRGMMVTTEKYPYEKGPDGAKQKMKINGVKVSVY